MPRPGVLTTASDDPEGVGAGVELHRTLEGLGLHLSVQTEGDVSERADCSRWVAIERLPPGAYFDPHQLQRLSRRRALGGASGALVLGDISPELAAMDASEVRALVYGDTEKNAATIGGRRHRRSTEGGGGTLKMRSSVPLHLRYIAPTSGGQTHGRVAIEPPELFLCCAASPHADGGGGAQPGSAKETAHADDLLDGVCPPLPLIGEEWRETCAASLREASTNRTATTALSRCGEWERVPVLGAQMLHARVPAGQLAHGDTVLAGTVLSLSAATLGLLWVLWRRPTPM